MPALRARQNSLRQQIGALDAQLADREVYLKLADSLEDFLTDLREKAATATVIERQRVLRLLVKDILVGPDKITIRHRIPIRHSPTDGSTETDSEDERRHRQLRWRSQDAALRSAGDRAELGAVGGEDPRLAERLHQPQHAFVPDPATQSTQQGGVVDGVEARLDIGIQHRVVAPGVVLDDLGDRVLGPAPRAEAVGGLPLVAWRHRL
jgi:site-specific DNA recombinase